MSRQRDIILESSNMNSFDLNLHVNLRHPSMSSAQQQPFRQEKPFIYVRRKRRNEINPIVKNSISEQLEEDTLSVAEANNLFQCANGTTNIEPQASEEAFEPNSGENPLMNAEQDEEDHLKVSLADDLFQQQLPPVRPPSSSEELSKQNTTLDDSRSDSSHSPNAASEDITVSDSTKSNTDRSELKKVARVPSSSISRM